MDVYLMMDDKHIQHVSSAQDDIGAAFSISEDNDYPPLDYHTSDASAALSVSSFGSSSMEDDYAYFNAPSEDAVCIPSTIHATTRASSTDNETLVPRQLTYTYSKDAGHDGEWGGESDGDGIVEGDDDDDDSLFGLGCLPDSICFSIGGLLNSGSDAPPLLNYDRMPTSA